MYKREERPQVYLVTGFIDFRCGIQGLVARLTSTINVDPKANALFVFMGKRKNSVKMLYWGGAGYWLLQYKPDTGKFKWVKEKGLENISYKQLEWLLDGLEPHQRTYIS